jgi:hypothetical protein
LKQQSKDPAKGSTGKGTLTFLKVAKGHSLCFSLKQSECPFVFFFVFQINVGDLDALYR